MRFNDEKDTLDVLEYFNTCTQNNIVYVKPGVYAMSSRKIESLIRIAYIQKYYQCNPVRFIDDFFNIELLDAQAWIVQQSWNCPNVLLVCSRGFGKSTLIDLIIMAKDMLFNNYWTYIASGSGSQAEQTFTTLERLANDNIDSMMGSTGSIFKAEIEVKNAAGDGFSHGSNGFTYSTYNGSMTQTLNSNIDKKRGRFFDNSLYCHMVIQFIRNFLKIDINEYNYLNEYNNITYVLSIDKNKFLDYIYQDTTIYLDRKYKKYLKLKKKLNDIISRRASSYRNVRNK